MDKRHAIRRFGLTILVGLATALTVALAAYALSSSRTRAYIYAPAHTPAERALSSVPARSAAPVLAAAMPAPLTPLAPLASTEAMMPAEPEVVSTLLAQPAAEPMASAASASASAAAVKILLPDGTDENAPYKGGSGGGDRAKEF